MRSRWIGWTLPFAVGAALTACSDSTPPAVTPADVVTADDVVDGGMVDDRGTPEDVVTPPDTATGDDVVDAGTTGDDVVDAGTMGDDVVDAGTPDDQGMMGTDVVDASACLMGQIECGGTCVDPATDTANCGVCGRACGTGQMCVGGTCQCPMGQMSCNGACVDLQSDPANCGGCGTACMMGQTCQMGACVTACNSPRLMCGTSCVDPQTDMANCGSCGTACAAGQTCTAGACTCAGGRRACTVGGMSVCVDTQTDNANCGDCGNACGAGQTCTAGSCACPSGRLFCGMGMSGSCVDTQTDNANCGACGTACGAGRTCVAGVCQCPSGQTSCGAGMAATCVNTQTDNANCGACGTACPMGQTCMSGACRCPGTQTACGGACVDTSTSNTNCGACGRRCGTGQTCMAGVCRCPSGQSLCNGACVDTFSNNANCGGCGMACAGTQTCMSGVCRCPAGQTACGTGMSATCVNAQTDNQNCGTCGTVCGGGRSCVAGACACPAGQSFCGTGMAAACTNTMNDNANCGMCGRACTGGASCSAGACVMRPPNDERVGAIAIDLSVPARTLSADTQNATNNTAGTCRCANGRDLFYSFTLTREELVYADTFGSAYDTALFLQNAMGANLTTANLTGGSVCSDDTCGGLQSQIVARLGAGTYYLVLSGCSQGQATIHFQHLPVGGTTRQLAATQGVTQTFSATLSGASAVSGTCCSNGPEDTYWLATCPSFTSTSIVGSTCDNDTTNTTLDQRSATRATVAACTEGGCGLRAQGTHTLPAGAGLHTVYVDSCTNTGPARDYVLHVTLGTCASPSVLCGSNRCANRTSDSQNCGACGNVCTGGRSCVSSTCVCPAGTVLCNGTCISTASDNNNCGACNNRCGAAQQCVTGTCQNRVVGQSFRINTLTTSSCTAVDVNSVAGDQRGGIAVSRTRAFHTGDSATIRADINTLGSAASVGAVRGGVFSNLRTGQVYAPGTNTGANVTYGSTMTRLYELNSDTGALLGSFISLSSPITLANTVTNGVYAGYDRVVIYNGTRVYNVSLPDGTVTDLGTLTMPSHTYCEAFANHGVAEFFGGDLYLAFVANTTTISRIRVRDGAVTTLATFTNLGDTCSFTVSPFTNRWYFGTEGTSQFRTGSETLGYCNATWSAPDDTFRMTTYGASSCVVNPVSASFNDDRGAGIAVSSTNTFSTGDGNGSIVTGQPIRWSASDLSGAATVSAGREGWVSNLRTGTVYVPGNNTAPVGWTGGTINTLIEVDGGSGALLTTRLVRLSTPITLRSSDNGIFSGWNRVVIWNGTRAYDISLPNGTVVDLGAVTLPTLNTPAAGAFFSGVAEYFGNAHYVDYVGGGANANRIIRVALPSGAATTLAQFTSVGAMQNITFSAQRNRWYFIHEGASQFRQLPAGVSTGQDFIGYCGGAYTNL